MTAYEIIKILIDVSALLVSIGGFIITLLAFLNKRRKRK